MSRLEEQEREPILIVDDDPISLRMLSATLQRLDYRVEVANDGAEAWRYFEEPGKAPRLMVLDWMMPVMDGPELCRRVRSRVDQPYTYIVFVTTKGRRQDVLDGFDAGCDDYLIKPYYPHELRSRVDVGRRILDLQQALHTKVDQLEHALSHVKQLEGLLPICMHCKQIRDDSEAWHQIEAYIERQTDASFTHTICSSCMEQHYPEESAAIRRRRNDGGCR